MLLAAASVVLPLIEPVIIKQTLSKIIPAELSAILLLLAHIPAVVAQTAKNERELPSMYQTVVMAIAFYICILISEKITAAIVTWAASDSDSSDDDDDDEHSDGGDSDDKAFENFTHSPQYSNIMEDIAHSLMLPLEESDAESSDETIRIEVEPDNQPVSEPILNLLSTPFKFAPMTTMKKFPVSEPLLLNISYVHLVATHQTHLAS